MLKILEIHKMPFLQYLDALNSVFGKFQPLKIAKNQQNPMSEAQKSKWQFLAGLESHKIDFT